MAITPLSHLSLAAEQGIPNDWEAAAHYIERIRDDLAVVVLNGFGRTGVNQIGGDKYCHVTTVRINHETFELAEPDGADTFVHFVPGSMIGYLGSCVEPLVRDRYKGHTSWPDTFFLFGGYPQVSQPQLQWLLIESLDDTPNLVECTYTTEGSTFYGNVSNPKGIPMTQDHGLYFPSRRRSGAFGPMRDGSRFLNVWHINQSPELGRPTLHPDAQECNVGQKTFGDQERFRDEEDIETLPVLRWYHVIDPIPPRPAVGVDGDVWDPMVRVLIITEEYDPDTETFMGHKAQVVAYYHHRSGYGPPQFIRGGPIVPMADGRFAVLPQTLSEGAQNGIVYVTVSPLVDPNPTVGPYGTGNFSPDGLELSIQDEGSLNSGTITATGGTRTLQSRMMFDDEFRVLYSVGTQMKGVLRYEDNVLYTTGLPSPTIFDMGGGPNSSPIVQAMDQFSPDKLLAGGQWYPSSDSASAGVALVQADPTGTDTGWTFPPQM